MDSLTVKLNHAALLALLRGRLPIGGRIFYLVRLRHARAGTLRPGAPRVIDIRSELSPTDATLAPDVAQLMGWPYLYSRSGIALQPSQSPEDLVAALARELHGDPTALTVVCL